MGTVTFGMLLALLFLSTPARRCRPVFILTLIVVFLGVLSAVLNVYTEIRIIRFPDNSVPVSIALLTACIDGHLPTLVNCILLFKVNALYSAPLHSGSTTPGLRYVITGLPAFVNIGRIVNNSVWIVQYAHSLSMVDAGEASRAATEFPSVTAELVMQIFANVVYEYSSSVRPGSIYDAICTIFWMTACNFVFPTALSVIQVIFRVAKADDYLYYSIAEYIQEVNLYLSIISVVFATAWSLECRWEGFTDETMAPSLRFAGHSKTCMPLRHAPKRPQTSLNVTHDLSGNESR
ncbi:hypothetical protein OF83DRAFT_1083987 [Amylostereum chailletii]|nr:hypothetical protein OF83DRAFT_1083987 [Amylostereum chailletii]